jgi:hypothetical protein
MTSLLNELAIAVEGRASIIEGEQRGQDNDGEQVMMMMMMMMMM